MLHIENILQCKKVLYKLLIIRIHNFKMEVKNIDK